MSLTRTEALELKFFQRQEKILEKRLSRMAETAAKLLAKKTAEYQADLSAAKARVAELSARV